MITFILVNSRIYGALTKMVITNKIFSSLLVLRSENIILISNPNIEIMGAGISSIVCQFVAFLITFTVLRKNIKLQFKVGRMVIAPIGAATIMGIATYFINQGLNSIISPNLSTIISIILGAIIYGILIILFKILKKEDMMMIPFGTKLYALLVKLRIYKEEPIGAFCKTFQMEVEVVIARGDYIVGVQKALKYAGLISNSGHIAAF